MINKLILLCTILFWLLFLGRTVILARQGVQVFTLVKGKPAYEKLIEIILVPLLVLWSIQIVFTVLNRPLFDLPFFWSLPALQWIGLSLCLMGLFIFLVALISFGDAWRVGIDKKNSNRLVTSGIFAYSRNPIFLFLDMYFGGVFLVYPTIFFLMFFIIFAIGIQFQILSEEKFLRSKFGDEYTRYCNRVRRYI